MWMYIYIKLYVCRTVLFLNILLFGLIPTVGCPKVLFSDRGSILISGLCQTFYKFMKIEHLPADAYMHTVVAVVERFNHTLRAMCRAAYCNNAYQWDLILQLVCLIFNLKAKQGGHSANYLEHGRQFRLPWDMTPPPDLSMDSTVTSEERARRLHQLLHITWDLDRDNLEVSQRKRKQQHDSKYQTNVTFLPGEQVLVLQPGRVDKMSMPNIGPYRIVSGPHDRDRYVLRDLQTYHMHSGFHVSKLRRWPAKLTAADELVDDYYVIDYIVDSRVEDDGETSYRVRWQGYGPKYDLWIRRADANPTMISEMDSYDKELSGGAETSTTSTPPATFGGSQPLPHPQRPQRADPQSADAGKPSIIQSTERAERAARRSQRLAKLAGASAASASSTSVEGQ